MAGYSDVRAVFKTAGVALDADGISTAAAVGNNAALTIGGALASGGAVALNAGQIVTILSAGDDSSKSFTVVGTDIHGDALTESITGANAGTATGSKFFKTIASITAVGNPAGNIVNSGTAGTIKFRTTSEAGDTQMEVGTVASATVTRDLNVPDEGVLFTGGIYITYTGATFASMTAFHA